MKHVASWLTILFAALVFAVMARGEGGDISALAERYDRALYRHWVDDDGDCQDTRQEVLVAESVEPPVLDEKGCKVVSGKWLDPYTGEAITDPRRLDIDHMVPLSEAHRSGAYAWTKEQRRAFANDLSCGHALIAVAAKANRSKGDKDPANWMPPNETFHCEYLRRWVSVKQKYGLSFDVREAKFIINSPCFFVSAGVLCQ